jgi:hypothetical protein
MEELVLYVFIPIKDDQEIHHYSSVKDYIYCTSSDGANFLAGTVKYLFKSTPSTRKNTQSLQHEI